MRALALVSAALLLALVVLVDQWGSPSSAIKPVAASGSGPGGTHESQPGPPRLPIESAEALEDGPGAASATRSGDLALLVLEHGSRRALPEVGLTAWIYGESGSRTLTVTVESDGRAFLSRGEFRDAKTLTFSIDDPELGSGHTFRPDLSIGELFYSRETLEILVPRGEWRDFHVVDSHGTPIAGATLEEHRLKSATTGPDGRGRVRMTVPPLEHVSAWAPGYRVEFVRVPREEEAWTITLGRANRIEFALNGSDNLGGYHVEMRLPETMRQRTFYQSHYVQTPGRPSDETPGRWRRGRYRGPSQWSLGFNVSGLAVLDQIYDGGTLEVELMHFQETLELRSLILPAEGSTLRVEFEVDDSPRMLSGHLVDEEDRPVAGARVRMAPLGGRATIDFGGSPGFPVWAPSTETNAAGQFQLPIGRDRSTVVVFSKRGLADRAMTIAEIEDEHHRVELERGRTVIVEVRDRNGEAIDGGWSSGDSYLHARPSVHLGHDVWRDVSSREHPAVKGRSVGIPYFPFADLPTGIVRFRFTYLPRDEFLLHDTSFPAASLVSRKVLNELGIGK